MAVSVTEAVVGTGGTLGTSPTISITTTPSAGDIVVVALQCNNTTAINSASGLGATWTKAFGTGIEDGANTSTCSVMLGTGATTSGTVTLNISTSRVGSLRAFVVSGITGDAAPNVSNSNTSTTLTSTTVTASQFVLALGMSNRTTGAVIFSATTPSSGWTSQANTVTASTTDGSAYYIPTGSTSHSVTLTNTASTGERTTLLSLGGTTPRIIASEYVEAMAVPSAVPRSIESEYVEAVTFPALTPRAIESYYVEVMTPATLISNSFTGWGSAM